MYWRLLDKDKYVTPPSCYEGNAKHVPPVCWYFERPPRFQFPALLVGNWQIQHLTVFLLGLLFALQSWLFWLLPLFSKPQADAKPILSLPKTLHVECLSFGGPSVESKLCLYRAGLVHVGKAYPKGYHM